MRKIILFGTGPLAKQIFNVIKNDTRYEIYGFCVEEKYLQDSLFCGLPVYPFEYLQDFYDKKAISVIVCIGYKKMNKIRENILYKCIGGRYDVISYISPNASVNSHNMGIGNIILDNVYIGYDCKIGDGNIFYPFSILAHDDVVGNYNFFSISASIAGNVQVGDFCFLGNNSTTKDGIKIADGTLVGAASYISKNTESWSVYAPVRTIKLEKSSLEIDL